MQRLLFLCFVSSIGFSATYDYRILSTFLSSTMEKQMNEAAEAGDAGFRPAAMTAARRFFGAEEICILRKD